VTLVKHLMDDEGNIFSFDDFHERFPKVGLDFLIYHGLVSSVMTYQKERKKEGKKIGVIAVLNLLIQTQIRGRLF